MKTDKKQCFGVIIGTRAYFNSELARDVRKQLLKTLEEQGYDYVILPEDATPTGSSSIETREDGLKCAELFRQNRDRIDGIIVSLPNFGFEIGIINAISVADLNVPVLVQACDDENDKVDLDSRRDAFCGKISVCNNLYQYGIPFTDTTLHTYSIYSPLLAEDINRFAGICRVVNGLRHCRIGQIGTRPLGFNTCRASEKLLQRSGITVVPADLSEIIFAAEAIKEDDPELAAYIAKTTSYAEVPEDYKSKVSKQCRFGLAVERWVKANQVDAVAIQCWDSLEQNYGCAACVTMSMLSDKNITEENVDETLRMQIPGIKWEMIENKAAHVMDIKVNEDDLKAFARVFAIQQLNEYGMGQMAEQMADYYADNMLKDKDQRRRLAHEAFTAKLFTAIHNAIKLNEKTVSIDEFRTIVAALNNATGAEVAAEEEAQQ